MKELKFFYSNNTYKLLKYSLKKIAPFLLDLSKENIIIVPDKLSLATEQEIFDALNIDVYYNLSVMGISKFANKIISENSLDIIQCSSQEAKLLVLKAIQNVCNNFKCFSKNYTLGFVDEIYAKIEQIKSSNACINDLIDENAGVGTKLKFEDLKLIYNEYETLRAEKIDSGALLDIFNQICATSESLKNTNVFFMGFDSLTKQGLQVLKNVVKNANYTQISVTYAIEQNNTRLYDQTFYDSIINLCVQEQIECYPQPINLPFKNYDKNLILKNLFSRESQFDKVCDYFDIIKANSFAEEIELCVKQINYLLKTTNTKLSDIAICADPSYFNILTSDLTKLGISVYSDAKQELYALEPTKFLINVLMFVYSKNPKHLYQILSNDFCGLKQDQTQSYMTTLHAFNSVKLVHNNQNNNHKDVISFVDEMYLQKISKSDNVENYVNIVKNLIKKYEIIEKINKKCDFFEKKQEVLLNKTFLQIEKKLLSCLEIIEKTLKNTTLTFDEFFEILEKILQETAINSVPSCVNQVFIGDLKSFYFGKKYLFVLGMNEGVLPSILMDTGLISDKEINSDSIKAKLEPTTKIINKRNKFKLFENILSPSKKCFMYYHAFGADDKSAQPNEFISELLFLFKNKIKSSQSLKYLSDESNLDKLCFNLLDEYNANLTLTNDLPLKSYTIIKHALQNNNAIFELNKTQFCQSFDIGKLFFKDDKTSISVIEKYNSCPKMAYLESALKLQPIKRDKVEKNIIGNFMHKVGELFVKYNLANLGQMSNQDISKSVEQIFTKVLEGDEYYALKLPKNSYLIFLLKAEALRFCTFLNQEQEFSDFKPIYIEKYFGKNSDFTPIELDVDGKRYTISGIVDRIDAYDDSFRIIDYKTGNTTNSGGAEKLYYGTKIQLFVYAFGIKNNLNKRFFGSFYLPIKNGFTKAGQQQYELSGFFENNAALALMCDKNALDNPKANIINATFKTDDNGELILKDKSNILSKNELDAYLNYSIKLVEASIRDIKSGYIDCSPMVGKCTYCNYNSICRFAKSEKVQRLQNHTANKEAIKNLMESEANE